MQQPRRRTCKAGGRLFRRCRLRGKALCCEGEWGREQQQWWQRKRTTERTKAIRKGRNVCGDPTCGNQRSVCTGCSLPSRNGGYAHGGRERGPGGGEKQKRPRNTGFAGIRGIEMLWGETEAKKCSGVGENAAVLRTGQGAQWHPVSSIAIDDEKERGIRANAQQLLNAKAQANANTIQIRCLCLPRNTSRAR